MQVYSKAHKKNVTLTCLFDNRSFGNGVQDWVTKYGYSTLYDSSIGPYMRHGGIDIVGGLNAAIHAVNGGEVVFAGWNGAAGNEVRIWTGSEMHRYLHLNSISTSVGAKVSEGALIGAEGGTGGYPVHLHFEAWRSKNQGDKIDPFNIAQKGGSGGGDAGGVVQEIAFVDDLSKWDKNTNLLGIYIGAPAKVQRATVLYANQKCTQKIRTQRVDGKTFDAEADDTESVVPIHVYKNTFLADVTDQLGRVQKAWVKF